MNKKILIIDDSALMRRVISDIINADDRLTVADTASNGLQAIQLLSEEKTYDMILCDIMMPKMDGVAFLKELSKRDIHEAAEIDGCTTFEKFIYITVPGLKNTLVYVLVSVIINSLKVFTQVYVLTNGGPSNATTTVVFQLYKAGFVNGQVGYSSAIAVTFFMLVMVISILQNKFAKED